MKRRTALTALSVLILPASFGLWVLSGYAGDAHCTAEEDGRGECDRPSDAANNAWQWLAWVCGGVSTLGGFFGTILLIAAWFGGFKPSRTETRDWLDGEVGS